VRGGEYPGGTEGRDEEPAQELLHGLAPPSPLTGYVAPGLEPVREAFRSGADDLGAGGGAFCAYVDGQLVVDLWGGHARPGVPWSEDTLSTLMSSTKGLVAVCAQVLVDRGLLDVDAPVSTYWPEFAQAGKGGAQVRHILDHTVGVLSFADPGNVLDWTGHGWDDHEAIAARLAASAPAWEPGTRIGYHAVSVGWLVGELVRRITGRSIGTFFHEEIATPLGLDAWIGTPVEHHHRMADVIPEPPGSLSPDQIRLQHLITEQRSERDSLLARAGITMHGRSLGDDLAGFMNTPRVRALEIPAANGSATARSLARMYAMLSMQGELDGVRILSPAAVRSRDSQPVQGHDAVLGGGSSAPVLQYALGYEGNPEQPGQPRRFGPGIASFGHAGAGGQLGFCDPEHRVAIGFVRNQLTTSPRFATRLIDLVYTCTD
jgi:CubicO group peptidase (beta-lactamase class C family)